MIAVTCPQCARRFRLPPERLGRRGARVRCAHCERTFDWIPLRALRPAGGGPGGRAAPFEAIGEAGRTEDRAPPGSACDPLEPPAEARVSAGGAPTPPGPASAIEELDPSDATPALVARLAVEELVNAGAGALLEAYADDALFARFGPALVQAWSRYQARLGPAADPELFREALRARLGIELPGREVHPPEGSGS